MVAPERRSPDYLQKFVESEIAKWAVPIKALAFKDDAGKVFLLVVHNRGDKISIVDPVTGKARGRRKRIRAGEGQGNTSPPLSTAMACREAGAALSQPASG